MLNKDLNYISLNDKYDDKIYISFSEFKLFNQCGHKHLLYRHLKLVEPVMTIHILFGDAIHLTLEKSIRESIGLSGRLELFKRAFSKSVFDNMSGEPGFRNDLNDFISHGEELLKQLLIGDLVKKYKIISVEEPVFSNIYGKYYFKGTIDLVIQNRETKRYIIVDWKTSNQNWNIKKKLEDKIFTSQLRFYKYFWSKKNSVPLSEIDCEYVVLSRMKDKRKPKLGTGGIQTVKVSSTETEIFYSLEMLADTIKKIHIDKSFSKIKHVGNEFYGCMFCKFKKGRHPLCNDDTNQHRELLNDNKLINK